MDSRSGQAGVLSQEVYVAARLPGPGGLEGQAEQRMSTRAIQGRGTGYEKREVGVSRGEAAGGSSTGQDFNPGVACGHLGPCGFLLCSPWAQQRAEAGGGGGGGLTELSLRTMV